MEKVQFQVEIALVHRQQTITFWLPLTPEASVTAIASEGR